MKHRKLKGRKRKHGNTGKLKGQKLKHGQHKKEFGGDYNDNNDFLGMCTGL